MAGLGIVPAPDSPYLELGATGQGRVFRKHLLTINKQFLHPKTGKPITLGEDAWRQMKDNFDSKRIIQTVSFPLADENNRHTENPLAVAGTVSALERDGDRVIATIDVRDPAVAERIADGRLPGASAFLALDAKDPATGERAGAALLHVCGTLRPALVDLAPYESVVAACGEAWDEFGLPDGSVWSPPREPLMLCQSEVDAPPPVMLADPDYQPEPVYGGPDMYEDEFLRDEFARLSMAAMDESSGRGGKPEYPLVVTDRDREVAMAAEAEITDEDFLGLASGTEPGGVRELAGRYGVSADAVYVMLHDTHIRSGLGHSLPERAKVFAACQVALSRGRLEVDDEQIVALSQARRDGEEEIEDMFIDLAAHPSKSGVPVTTATRAHSSELDEDPSDEDQPHRGGDVHKKIRKIIEDNPELFSDGKGRAFPQYASHPPKSPAERHLEETYALDGGRPGGRSIPDLARGSARTRSGR
jgi:hypothetical protein